jgi:hypothetical protein
LTDSIIYAIKVANPEGDENLKTVSIWELGPVKLMTWCFTTCIYVHMNCYSMYNIILILGSEIIAQLIWKKYASWS